MQDQDTSSPNAVIGEQQVQDFAADVEGSNDSAVVEARPLETGKGAPAAPKAPGLKIARRYTEPGEDVWNTVEWEKRSAVITGEKGDIVFEQHDIDVRNGWTQLATNVVASKY